MPAIVTHWYLAAKKRARRRATEKAIREYFDSLHTTLFSQAYDLTDYFRREQAVTFVADLIDEIGSRCGQ